jgi:hypothetical protein
MLVIEIATDARLNCGTKNYNKRECVRIMFGKEKYNYLRVKIEPIVFQMLCKTDKCRRKRRNGMRLSFCMQQQLAQLTH